MIPSDLKGWAFWLLSIGLAATVPLAIQGDTPGWFTRLVIGAVSFAATYLLLTVVLLPFWRRLGVGVRWPLFRLGGENLHQWLIDIAKSDADSLPACLLITKSHIADISETGGEDYVEIVVLVTNASVYTVLVDKAEGHASFRERLPRDIQDSRQGMARVPRHQEVQIRLRQYLSATLAEEVKAERRQQKAVSKMKLAAVYLPVRIDDEASEWQYRSLSGDISFH